MLDKKAITRDEFIKKHGCHDDFTKFPGCGWDFGSYDEARARIEADNWINKVLQSLGFPSGIGLDKAREEISRLRRLDRPQRGGGGGVTLHC